MKKPVKEILKCCQLTEHLQVGDKDKKNLKEKSQITFSNQIVFGSIAVTIQGFLSMH